MPKQLKSPQEIREALTGPCPSLRTTFDQHGNIDYKGIANSIDILLAGGAKNIIITHGDSLLSLLSEKEIAELTKFVVDYVQHRALVVAATGIWSTLQTEEFAKYCAQIKADMLMVLPCDWGRSCTVQTLVSHYARAAEHIPVMLVTNYLGSGAGRTQPFAFDLFSKLYNQVPGVVAVKDDVCNLFARKLCAMTNDKWAIIAGGWKDNHLNMLPYGVDGYLSIFITINPKIAWDYFNAAVSGDYNTACDIINKYDIPLREAVTDGLNFDAALHGIIEMLGIAKRYRRLPYNSLNDEQMEILKEKLKAINIL